MKIVGKDGKIYATVDECLKADKLFESSHQKVEEKNTPVESAKKTEISKRKKELADAVQAADTKVDLAYKAYDTAKEEARKILEEANTKAEEVLKKAAVEVEKATETRMNSIKKFNDEFGAYTKCYTGDKALEEYYRVIKKMRDIFTPFWF